MWIAAGVTDMRSSFNSLAFERRFKHTVGQTQVKARLEECLVPFA